MNWDLVVFSKIGNVDIVKLLIDNGADLRSYGKLWLITASEYGHYDVVKLLIDYGVKR